MLTGFATWKDVLAHASTGAPLYYQAPLDARPLRFTLGSDVLCYEPRARTIRMYPPGCFGRGRARTSDPFTADAGHLSRFSREEA